MVDPLSIAASVAGLVSLGLQSTEYLYNFYAACRDQDENVAKTKDRLNDLLGVLSTVNEVIQARHWRADEQTILQRVERCISRCQDVIEELAEEVQKFKKEPRESFGQAIRAVGRRAAYPFRRSTLGTLQDAVDDCRGNLAQALDILQLKEHQNTQNDIKVLQEIISRTQAKSLDAELRAWLQAPDPSIDYNAAGNKRHEHTGQWLIKGEAFVDWLRAHNSFLWLYGFAGCGKSVLCSTAIRHVFDMEKSLPGAAIAFFFFSFNDQSKQDATALLKSLLSQLSGQIPGLQDALKQLQKDCSGQAPSIAKLTYCLESALVGTSQIFILIDALDECPHGQVRDDVLHLLETIRRWSLPGLHLLVTSRDIPDIRDALSPQTHEAVSLKNNAVQEDIERYVSHCVEHDPKLRRLKQHREMIRESLVQRADSGFRWVDCQLGTLHHCPVSKHHVQRCLRTLPRTLDETYERMLSAIDATYQDDARRILSLLCLAPRELSVMEVIEAIAVDTQERQCYDIDRRLESSDDLLRICPGLIEVVYRALDANITRDLLIDFSEDSMNASDRDWAVNWDGVGTSNFNEDGTGDFNEEDADKFDEFDSVEIVRIAHFSVQEYLISDRIGRGKAADFAISREASHAEICKTCLLYLSHDDFLDQVLTPTLLEQYRFAKFAADNWTLYYLSAGSSVSQELDISALSLFRIEACFNRWLRLIDPDAPPRSQYVKDPWYRERKSAAPTKLYCVAALVLDYPLYQLLSTSAFDTSIQNEADLSNALWVAAREGHENSVRILLDYGAEVDGIGGKLGTALHAASIDCHESIVEQLLDAGADVNIQAGWYGDALQAASRRGHEQVVRRLLKAGADVNLQGGEYGTTLQAASYHGHEQIVRQLLDAGADVNIQGGNYGTALQVASRYGHEQIVRQLLDGRADVNIQGGIYGTALQVASVYGHKQVVRRLLAAGADVNIQGGWYATALQAASHYGHEQIVRQLLDAGADVNIRGADYSTALQVASVYGHKQVVRQLLAAGADVNAVAKMNEHWHDRTALQAAKARGHLETAQILIEAGAVATDDDAVATNDDAGPVVRYMIVDPSSSDESTASD